MDRWPVLDNTQLAVMILLDIVVLCSWNANRPAGGLERLRAMLRVAS